MTASGGVMGARSTSGVLPGDALRPDTAIGSLAPAWLTDGSKLRSALVVRKTSDRLHGITVSL
jgi:hypothetical protein